MWHSGIASNMNFPTPIAVLGFLAAIGGLVLSVLAAITFLFLRKARWTRWLGALVGAAAFVYFGLLFAMSLASREETLAPGQEKYFCEIDCHLAYAVAATKSESLPGGMVRHTVTVKVRFDEETISSRRPRDATLTPNSRYVALVDDAGRQYPGSADGLKRKLIPGESYTTDIVFDVPADAKGLRLVLRNNDLESTFIIGHENSVLHGKTTFAWSKAS